jgi:hypothetical protein
MQTEQSSKMFCKQGSAMQINKVLHLYKDVKPFPEMNPEMQISTLRRANEFSQKRVWD